MWNDTLILMHLHKKQLFSGNSSKISLKIGKFFQGFVVFPYDIKDIWVYLMDTGSHLLNLMQNNSEQS